MSQSEWGQIVNGAIEYLKGEFEQYGSFQDYMWQLYGKSVPDNLAEQAIATARVRLDKENSE